MVMRRECCYLSCGEGIEAGLRRLQRWAADCSISSGAWKRLHAARQAAALLTAPNKYHRDVQELAGGICPGLSPSQLHRLAAQYFDDRRGANTFSGITLARLKQASVAQALVEGHPAFLIGPSVSLAPAAEALLAPEWATLDPKTVDAPLPERLRGVSEFKFFGKRAAKRAGGVKDGSAPQR
jgi:hypothetical protein